MRTVPSRSRRVLLALALVPLAFQACALDPFAPPGDRENLREARAEWERQEIASYRYTLFKACGECMPEMVNPARVEVRDGRTVSVVALDAGRPIGREYFHEHDAVEDLFAAIEAALAQDPHRFEARYDERRGLPVAFSVDHDREMVDDEAGFTVADFEIIP